MTTALTTTAASAIEPRDMGELRALATSAAATKFFGVSTPEQALLVMVTGRDLGLSYAQSLRAFHVVQGRPVLSAQGAVAICLKHRDVCEYVRTIESSDTVATVEAKRRGDPPRRVTFTIEEAKRAKLTGRDVWQSYPSRMLLARAQMFVCREVFPDLLLGMYSEDELEPAPQRVDVEARRVPDAPPTPRSGTRHEPDFAALLGAATSVEELADIAAHMKAASLSPDERAALRPLYVEARARCERMAAVVVEAVNEDAEP